MGNTRVDMSSFGTLFRVTTFGESHCKGVGCIVDGCPPGMQLTESDIQTQLTRRRPGQSVLTTPRNEADQVTILSGTEQGCTLGTPIGLFVPNSNVRPGDYTEMAQVPRPGHAEYTYQLKYGTRASSGGGRSSARETIGRVAPGAVAEKWLKEEYDMDIVCYVDSIGDVRIPAEVTKRWSRQEIDELGWLRLIVPEGCGTTEADSALAEKSFLEAAEHDTAACYINQLNEVYDRNGNTLDVTPALLEGRLSDAAVTVRCPHGPTAARMSTLIRKVKSEKDSIGGTVTCVCTGVPPGLGEPCFDKLEAKLAQAMLSLPATKGFEIGSVFEGTKQRGSTHNDMFTKANKQGQFQLLGTATNNAGGTLGGISHGADVVFRVAIKPVSTIGQPQETVRFDGEASTLEARGRHDPCVLPRVPPIVETMAAIVMIDAALIQRSRCAESTIHPRMLLGEAGNDAKRQRL